VIQLVRCKGENCKKPLDVQESPIVKFKKEMYHLDCYPGRPRIITRTDEVGGSWSSTAVASAAGRPRIITRTDEVVVEVMDPEQGQKIEELEKKIDHLEDEVNGLNFVIKSSNEKQEELKEQLHERYKEIKKFQAEIVVLKSKAEQLKESETRCLDLIDKQNISIKQHEAALVGWEKVDEERVKTNKALEKDINTLTKEMKQLTTKHNKLVKKYNKLLKERMEEE
jgi:chromosome segregation ATPase